MELLGAPATSSTDSIPTGFCSQKLWGLTFLTLESWARGLGVGLGLLASEIAPKNFYLRGCGATLFHIHDPSTSLDGCGSFSFVGVRLPFNSISDVSQ